jgi:hypothetical protein
LVGIEILGHITKEEEYLPRPKKRENALVKNSHQKLISDAILNLYRVMFSEKLSEKVLGDSMQLKVSEIAFLLQVGSEFPYRKV